MMRIAVVLLAAVITVGAAAPTLLDDDSSRHGRAAAMSALAAPAEVDAPARNTTVFTCNVCEGIVDLVEYYIERNATIYDLEGPFIDLCSAALTADGYNGTLVCPGIVRLYAPSVVFVLVHLGFPASDVCARMSLCPSNASHSAPLDPKLVLSAQAAAASYPGFRTHGRRSPFDQLPPARLADVAPLPDPASARMLDGDKWRATQVDAGRVLRFVQMSDLHMDPLYAVGSASLCGSFMCCRAEFKGTGAAGPAGDYNCDLPQATLENMLELISTVIKPDFVLWTGDNPPHDLWNTSLSHQVDSSTLVVNVVRKYLSNYTVFPALGNHEGFPPNEYYAPTDMWLTQTMASLWSTWLPADALETVAAGGYYTALVRPGLRIVAMNTQYGYIMNFYSLLDDAVKQCEQHYDWLNATLLAAEAAGERVLLIGHVPTGKVGDSLNEFAVRISYTVARFHATLVGVFVGHEHTDEFEVMRHPLMPELPLTVQYLAPSVTTFTGINPSFRIFSLDLDTGKLIDFEHYFCNVTAANARGTAGCEWELEYSAREAYGLPSMSPEAWYTLSKNLRTDAGLASAYVTRMQASASPKTCDDVCREVVSCSTQSSTPTGYGECVQEASRRTGLSVPLFYYPRNC
jgi:sphingomyelin phosphodiesterase